MEEDIFKVEELVFLILKCFFEEGFFVDVVEVLMNIIEFLLWENNIGFFF